MTPEAAAIAYLMDRIPVLRELRGAGRIEAEEAIANAVADAIEDYVADFDGYVADCDEVAVTGGAPRAGR